MNDHLGQKSKKMNYQLDCHVWRQVYGSGDDDNLNPEVLSNAV
jgi:hypothetical protein